MTPCERCGQPLGPDDLVTCAPCAEDLDRLFAPFAPLVDALVDAAMDGDVQEAMEKDEARG